MQAVLAACRKQWADWQGLQQRVGAALPLLVDALVHEFGAREVVLFGSLALTAGPPSPRPDIDLLVAGLAPERLGAALARMFLLAPLPVDLVPSETARPDIVARARLTGRRLFPPADAPAPAAPPAGGAGFVEKRP